TDVAMLNGTNTSEVSRLPFAFIAPKIAASIVAGDQPVELTAHRLSRVSDLPLGWTSVCFCAWLDWSTGDDTFRARKKAWAPPSAQAAHHGRFTSSRHRRPPA
ncbi:MAG: hypothetical protein E5X63_41785, partial [Mesorhizobium sp.]